MTIPSREICSNTWATIDAPVAARSGIDIFPPGHLGNRSGRDMCLDESYSPTWTPRFMGGTLASSDD